MAIIDFAGFDWDQGNRLKCQRHGMTIEEVEFVLAHQRTLMVPSAKSSAEPRYLAIGNVPDGRYALVVFTPRQRGAATILGPVSARFMHRREVKKYEQKIAGLQNG